MQRREVEANLSFVIIITFFKCVWVNKITSKDSNLGVTFTQLSLTIRFNEEIFNHVHL